MRPSLAMSLFAAGVSFGFYWGVSVSTQPTKTLATAPTLSGGSFQPKNAVIATLSDDMLYLDANVNDNSSPLRFLIDTGASGVALSFASATRLGIVPEADKFTAETDTAGGKVKLARVTIKKIVIGNVRLENVKAFIFPPDGYTYNLLGMSFMKRVGWTYYNGRLLIEQ